MGKDPHPNSALEDGNYSPALQGKVSCELSTTAAQMGAVTSLTNQQPCLGQNGAQRVISNSAAERWVQGQARKSNQWVWMGFTGVQAQAQTQLLHSCSVTRVGAVFSLSLQAALEGKEGQDLIPSFPCRGSYHQCQTWTQTAELCSFSSWIPKRGMSSGPQQLEDRKAWKQSQSTSPI